MQLIFTVEEFRVLTHILRERERELHHEGRSQEPVWPLLKKVLNRDLYLDIDELEDLENVLREHTEKLKRELEGHLRPDDRKTLLHRQQLVEHIIERVDEACVMV